MNELIIFVAKERLIPSNNILDLPTQFLERQLYRLAYFLIQSVINVIYNNFSPFSFSDEDEKVKNSLYVVFSYDWLQYALKSHNYHLCSYKFMDDYYLSEKNKKLIYSVVEFFCFELIETSILIRENFLYNTISNLHPYDILQGLYHDTSLYNVIHEQNIYIVDTITIKSQDVKFPNINISKKGIQLIRIFIEILINNEQ